MRSAKGLQGPSLLVAQLSPKDVGADSWAGEGAR